MRVEIVASEEILRALVGLGRTEDVKFAPDGRRLAIAAYLENKIALVDVEIDGSGPRKTVVLSRLVEVTSPDLSNPHGLCFLDQDTLIVANRGGAVPILKLPPRGTGDATLARTALRTLRGGPCRRIRSPGSVAAAPLGDGLYEVLICNNYVNRVTRHVLDGQAGFRVRRNGVLLGRWLDIPDGVAVNRDRRWVAVSNHVTHSVLLFEVTPRLNRRSKPDGVLYYADFPHGLCFTPDDNFVIVASAGSQCVQVYAKAGTDWQGAREPIRSLRVIDTEAFLRGRNDPREGGVKGVDVDREMRLLVTTCHQQPLAFFDLARVLAP